MTMCIINCTTACVDTSKIDLRPISPLHLLSTLYMCVNYMINDSRPSPWEFYVLLGFAVAMHEHAFYKKQCTSMGQIVTYYALNTHVHVHTMNCGIGW